MKRTLIPAFLLAILLLLSGRRTEAALSYYRSYSDIAAHTDLQTAAEWARLSDVMRGKSKAAFRPAAALTGKVLVKALEKLDPTYKAVKESRYVLKKGKPATGGIAKNAKAVTREQFAVALYAYARSHQVAVSKKKKLSSFRDYSALGYGARKAYRWAYKAGFVPKADASGHLRPSASVTRQEAVMALYQLHLLLPNYREELFPAADFREILLREIAEVVPYGGYSTSGTPGIFKKTAWQGLHQAYRMKGKRPVIDLAEARPSFCSGATYLLLVRALLTWDTTRNSGKRIPKSSWVAMKPYTLSGLAYPAQNDGVGLWGRANANGPGMAVLIKEVGAGRNLLIKKKSEYKSESAYWKAWGKAKPGDFLKIFRSDAIGRSERGHMVVYLGSQKATRGGVRDDRIWYWSSNGSKSDASKGYYITSCYASEITRGVITQVTNPAAFVHADAIAPTNVDSWLASLLGDRDVTVAEMQKHI